MRARIVGTGSYLPQRILTNADLERMVDTTDAWITERTGVKERHLASPDEATSDLATEAARRALDMAGMSPEAIDLIIIATLTPDHFVPATGSIVQKNLGAKNAAAFDLNAACSGFVYSLSVADQFIRGGALKTVLVVGAEVLTRYTNWDDRTTCVLFGDGAGAAVLRAEKDDSFGIQSTHIHCDGTLGDLLYAPGGGSRFPSTHESLDMKLNTVRMRGNETFRVAVTRLSEVVDEVLQANNLKPGDIDFLVPHQANLRIIQATAKKLNMSMDKVVVTVDRHANTSAASVPMALDEAVRSGRIQPGMRVLLEAFGGGLTWAAALVRW